VNGRWSLCSLPTGKIRHLEVALLAEVDISSPKGSMPSQLQYARTLLTFCLITYILMFLPLSSFGPILSALRYPFRSTNSSTMAFNVLTTTASELQQELNAGKINSVQIVEAYLKQIDEHEDYLHALIAQPPRRSILQVAQLLDDERRAGKSRGQLHGIPVLVKVDQQLLIQITASI
jgi:hypothetical protein